MKEIKRGLAITGALLRTIFTKMFQYINDIDPTYISMTTGQIICTDKKDNPTKWSDMLSVYSDQYYKTDIMLEQYAGEDVSYLQRYIDELEDIKRGV
ncbi:MAG: hypothetical protein BWY74_03788 [Firmicutes bacterium ADurb.Bin419]|nr:MAG: hypothetical protein BWY74_03788 [Firmicutes bacterium ADurb.Bin419]